MDSVLRGCVAVIVAPVLGVTASRIRRHEFFGPLPEAGLADMMARHFRTQYVIGAAVSVAIAAMITAPHLLFLEIVPAVVLGWPAGRLYSRLRLAKAEVSRGGPGPDVPDERLFPSDRFARLLHQAVVPPLPLWQDLLFLLVLSGLGALCGLGSGFVFALWRG